MNNTPFPGSGRPSVILDALPDGLVLVNGNGTVVGANATALALFEAPGTALVGRGLLDLFPDFDWRLVPDPVPAPHGAGGPERAGPRRMTARRTDGGTFTAEVFRTRLADGRDPDGSSGGHGTDHLLMLVVRDLTGALDAEAELAGARRQTAAVLRAVTEGVLGTDSEGRIVLVNPAAAQMLGYRAGRLGGRQLHPLLLHTRADGEPYPFEESPLADTLRSGRRHRVRGQVLWTQDGTRIPVDLTTAPVYEEGGIVGAIMTFTDRRPAERLAGRHADELAARSGRHAAELRRHEDRYAALAGLHAHLTAVVGGVLHGHLEETRPGLTALAADDAGHLWPEAGRLLGRLAAGHARLTALLDDVLDHQGLASGTGELRRRTVGLDRVVDAALHRAAELLGDGRTEVAVHTSPVEAEVDPERLATALAHLVADVVRDGGADGREVPGPDRGAPPVVVVAARRGDTVRIEVRGPYAGGDSVHQPIVRGLVGAHGGVVERYGEPGTSGGAHVVEVPIGSPAGRPAASGTTSGARVPAPLARTPVPPAHRHRRGRHALPGAAPEESATAADAGLRGGHGEGAVTASAREVPDLTAPGAAFFPRRTADVPLLASAGALPPEVPAAGARLPGRPPAAALPPARAGEQRPVPPGPMPWPEPAGGGPPA